MECMRKNAFGKRPAKNKNTHTIPRQNILSVFIGKLFFSNPKMDCSNCAKKSMMCVKKMLAHKRKRSDTAGTPAWEHRIERQNWASALSVAKKSPSGKRTLSRTLDRTPDKFRRSNAWHAWEKTRSAKLAASVLNTTLGIVCMQRVDADARYRSRA